MTENNIIRFYHNGEEYVTRAQILDHYHMPPSNFERRIEKTPITRVSDCNKFYYRLSEVEAFMQTYLNEQ